MKYLELIDSNIAGIIHDAEFVLTTFSQGSQKIIVIGSKICFGL